MLNNTTAARGAWGLLAPAIAFLAIFYVAPVLYTFALSFTEPSFGLANFAKAFDPLYRRVFTTSFEIAISVSALCLLIAYPTALFIVSRSRTTSGLLLVLVIVPFFTSLLVRNYAWIFLLGTRGVINSTLMYFGIIDKPLSLMFNRLGVVIGMTHVLLPYLVLILVTALRGIDERLIRAGASLGAGPYCNFRRVTFPLSLPAAGGGFVLTLVIALAFFVTPAMLGSPRDSMIANAIASEIGFLNWGFAAALGIILLAITLVAVAIMQRAFGGIALIAPSLAVNRTRSASRGRLARALNTPLALIDRILDPIWNGLVATVGVAALAFLVLPVLIVIPLSFSSAEYFVFPPPGWTLRWYEAFFSNRQWINSLTNSFTIAAMTVVITMSMAVPAALGIARSSSRSVIAAYLLIISPLVVPTILTAISIFFSFTQMGLSRKMIGIAIGHSIGALPLAVVVLVSAFGSFDWNLERAAQSLGASRLRTLFKIILPILSGTVATAAFLVFLHSFDDLLVALFLGGVRLETLPRRMWESLQEINPTIAAVSTLMIIFMVTILMALQLFQQRQANRFQKGK